MFWKFRLHLWSNKFATSASSGLRDQLHHGQTYLRQRQWSLLQCTRQIRWKPKPAWYSSLCPRPLKLPISLQNGVSISTSVLFVERTLGAPSSHRFRSPVVARWGLCGALPPLCTCHVGAYTNILDTGAYRRHQIANRPTQQGLEVSSRISTIFMGRRCQTCLTRRGWSQICQLGFYYSTWNISWK